MGRFFCAILLGTFLTLTASLEAASTNTNAFALISVSAQLDPAQTTDANALDYRLEITSVPETLNGEAMPASSDVAFSHTGFFRLHTPFDVEPVITRFRFDIPDFDDSNTNGLHDFYDVELAVAETRTQGEYFNAANNRFMPLNVLWQRSEGSSAGACVIDIPDLGLTFVHAFRLVRYLGTYTSTRSGQQLQGQIKLANENNAEDTISGNLNLSIVDNEQLTWSAGTWDGTFGFVFRYEPFDPFDLIGGSFLSTFESEDGWSATSQPDYQIWIGKIDAPDTNNNNIADLLESGAVQIPPPRLVAVKGANGIEITVIGTAGQTYSLEERESAATGSWTFVQSVTVAAGAPAIIRPTTGPQKFYRLRQ